MAADLGLTVKQVFRVAWYRSRVTFRRRWRGLPALVLLVGGLAILGLHEFRGQWDHFVTTRLDHDRRQHRMEIRHRAVGVVLGRAVRAMNLLRGKVAGPVQRKQ